jgi:hypothetical protein
MNTDNAMLPIVEEELQVGKRRFDTERVRVSHAAHRWQRPRRQRPPCGPVVFNNRRTEISILNVRRIVLGGSVKAKQVAGALRSVIGATR